MKYIYICLLFLIYSSSFGQDYFSKIIPTTDNPLAKKLIKPGDQYIISADFFAEGTVKGGLIIVDQDDTEKIKFENMDLGLSPILVLDESIYLVGENPLNQADSTLFLSKIDKSTLEIEWFKEYSCPIVTTVNTTVKRIKDELFIFNVNNAGTDFVNQRELMIIKTNLEGEELAKYRFNTDKRTTYGYELLNTYDSNLILSNIYSIEPIPGRGKSQLIKISNDGETLWTYEGEERLDNGTVATWAIELSDSTILQTYYVDRKQDPEFIINDWYPLPNKFIWVSKEGEFIKDKTIIHPYADVTYIAGLKKGNGDYFFSYGYYEDSTPFINNSFFCHLTKFTNTGDTIWTHRYQHPSNPDGNTTHNIKDIIEEENGDITVLAEIAPIGEKKEIWLFKLNSDGCYVNEECEDMNDIVGINEEQENNQPILFPNPVIDVLNVVVEEDSLLQVEILDQLGQSHLYVKRSNSNHVQIDVSQLPKGFYFVSFTDEKGHQKLKKFLKF